MAILDSGTKYDNAEWDRCARTGGVTMAICGGDGHGQGNAGVELPCRGCWVQKRNFTTDVKMSIGTPASAVFGVLLAEPQDGAQPMWVPISDVSQLYFYGLYNVVIDIIFLLG